MQNHEISVFGLSRSDLWSGHTPALALVGYLVLSLKWTIPLQMAAHMEVMVGVMIVALGVHLLWRAVQPWTAHLYEHDHGKTTHSHIHGQDHACHSHYLRGSPAKVLLVSFVRGMAGSSSLSFAFRPCRIAKSMDGILTEVFAPFSYRQKCLLKFLLPTRQRSAS